MIKLNLLVLFAQRGIRVADADRMTDMGRSILYEEEGEGKNEIASLSADISKSK